VKTKSQTEKLTVTRPSLASRLRSRPLLANLALLALALTVLSQPAKADPVSISTIITAVSAQASSIITEALPFLAVVIGGAVLFKLVRKFVR